MLTNKLTLLYSNTKTIGPYYYQKKLIYRYRFNKITLPLNEPGKGFKHQFLLNYS